MIGFSAPALFILRSTVCLHANDPVTDSGEGFFKIIHLLLQMAQLILGAG